MGLPCACAKGAWWIMPLSSARLATGPWSQRHLSISYDTSRGAWHIGQMAHFQVYSSRLVEVVFPETGSFGIESNLH